MQRKVFDQIASGVGAVIVVVLLVAGGLLTWGYTFAHSNVHDQLAQQQVFFPPKSAFEHPKAGTEITPSMIPSVSQYAGQQVLTGQQARVYANDFIAVHLSEMPYGGVYSNVSAAARAATPGSPASGEEPERARDDGVSGHHAPWTVAPGVCVRDDRHPALLGRDRVIRPGGDDGGPRHRRHLARTPDD